MTHPTATTIDVREIAPRDRHPLIFSTFRSLPAGESMQLVNDHDPRPLYHQLQAQMPGGFSWEYLQAGPDTWRVSITKVASEAIAASTADQCCGSCGCA